MKTYKGKMENGNAVVTVNGESLDQIVRASPSGFNWGYSGDGPTDLAYSVLADLYDEQLAEEYHEDFMDDIIRMLEQDSEWEMTEKHIQFWLWGVTPNPWEEENR
mgnify:CR=1 FL=1